MTGHIDRDELRMAREDLRKIAEGAPDYEGLYIAPSAALMILDALDQAEAERDYRRRENAELFQQVEEERGATLDQIEQVKIRDARIKAVRDVLDQEAPDPTIATRVRADTIRRALDGDSTNRK